MKEETFIWRGTYGVGDVMQGLNVAHRYAHRWKFPVNLEIHWIHDEHFKYHPDDPETIIERAEFIKEKYFRNTQVRLSHVFFSDRFRDKYWNVNKDRHYFTNHNGIIDDDSYKILNNQKYLPSNQWLFKPQEFVEPKKEIVIFGPHHNAEPPRTWKRVVSNDSWRKIIRNFQWKGWTTTELTYRTPIEEAYESIKTCRFVLCYDGMWHRIAGNFSKPILMPSCDKISKYLTPNAVLKITERSYLMALEEKRFAKTLKIMNDKSKIIQSRTAKEIDWNI